MEIFLDHFFHVRFQLFQHDGDFSLQDAIHTIGAALATRSLVPPFSARAMISGDTHLVKPFLKMGHSWRLFLYFCLFYLNVQLIDKILPMLGFEPRITGIGSDRTTN